MPKRRVLSTRNALLDGLLGTVLAGVLLYMAKPVLVPLALAVLLSFILTPIVALGQRFGLRRSHSVFATVCLTFVVVGLIGWVTSAQVQRLAEELPQHKTQIAAKIDRLRQMHGGPIGDVLEMVRELESSSNNRTSHADEAIVVKADDSSALIQVVNALLPALEPLATAFLVVILVIFILANREDLRDRILSLVHHSQVADTTRMLGDTASRLGTFLLAQLFVNAGFGIVFGLVTWSVGVPFAFLWGLLTTILRFVPYVGTWLAASLPMILSFALFPNWSQTLTLLVAFIVIDLITANALEPLVFGHHIGVTPVALLIAAAFWTWIWGPIGLLLSTPLTVCMVVLGQHVPRFRFLTLLLSGKPRFSPHVALYQRLLAGDTHEATERVLALVRQRGITAACDEVLIPALRQVRRDRERDNLSPEEESRIYDAMRELIDKLPEPATNPPGLFAPAKWLSLATGAASDSASAPETEVISVSPSPDTHLAMLGCAAHHAAEELITRMLRVIVEPQGVELHEVSTRVLPSDIVSLAQQADATTIFIATLPPGGVPQASYLCELLHAKCPEARIVVGYWGPERAFDRVLRRMRRAGASHVATSLAQARSQVSLLTQGAA